MTTPVMQCGRCPACEAGRAGCVLEAYAGGGDAPTLTERQIGALRRLSAAGLLAVLQAPEWPVAA